MKFRCLLSLIFILAISSTSFAFTSNMSLVYQQKDPNDSDQKTLEDLTSPHTNPRPLSIMGTKKFNDYGIEFRTISNQELLRMRDRDPELTLTRVWDILARINIRASYHITMDIQNGLPMKIPNDFSVYKNWSPLPNDIQGFENVPKSVLIVKDIPFLGWYEYGKLVGDSVVCIGKQATWTKAGLFRVKDKDPDHVSRSYPNILGQPAPMPYALRIYDRVWIHGGDIPRGNCSHGCINLPLRIAEEVFEWADYKTLVLILNSLDDLDRVLRKGPSEPSRFAQQQIPRSSPQAPPQIVTPEDDEDSNDPLE